MDQTNRSRLHELLGSKLGCAPGSWRAVGEFAWICSCVSEKVLEIRRRHLGMSNKRRRKFDHHAHRNEGTGVEVQFAPEVLTDDEWARRRGEQGVPIGI